MINYNEAYIGLSINNKLMLLIVPFKDQLHQLQEVELF